MNTITVTCPRDGEQFAVVEPEDHSQYSSLTATCPSCKKRFVIVYPEEIRDSRESEPTYEPFFGEITEWELRDDPPDPYTGRDETIPCEQFVVAKVGGLGGSHGADEGSDLHKNPQPSRPDRFQIWYTPDHEAPQWEEVAYVVRADLETGVKTKNIYSVDEQLVVKNRGIPRDSDKQWTYLDLAECRARAAQAQLDGGVAEVPGIEGRYHIPLNQKKQLIVNEDGELASELVLELARVLVAFQTQRID